MARINLLPWREELREERKKQFLMVLLGTAVVAGITIFLGDMQINGAINYQQSRNEFLKKEIAALDKRIVEIKELKKKREELLERMKVIQDLQGNRPIIVRVFDELVKSVPDGVYFTSLEMKKNQLLVNGFAESNNRVSNLMRDFDNSEWFTSPNLTSVKAADKSDLANQFVLTVNQTTPKALQEQQKKEQEQ
ncbi:PilN domain-containing protein [Spartinivicinus poritis]|uniref:PilN domain-containing protein n=1 Tax=Spartinivicinus poritis TaxID=2994640 RepID=A0ABT5U5X6_9GAMM|nr:PilN domain-containing protein [Spartinivicinus sp. A2-2]MDE1461768.1 PilN domain-containing protein [Spartinivicinus sp. A2-2]